MYGFGFWSVHVIVGAHRDQRHQIPGVVITDTCGSPGPKMIFDKCVKNTLREAFSY